MKRILLTSILLLVSLAGFAQSLSGKVTEENGEPVIGAAIYYEGLTSVSAVTNFNGEYSIKAIAGKTLVFSCIGLKNETVAVTGPGTLDVVMKPDGLLLEDAVVVGYGTQQRGDLTGSISSVKAHEIRQSGTPDLMSSLQGKVAGLNITSQSGEPGSGYSISIRGNNSINASSAPLIVIDGMQMDVNSSDRATSSLYSSAGSDPLSFLNPSDIKSVEVLKDASATAIYGSRGAGGVILITTKSGAENSGATVVTFDASLSVSEAARDLEMLDGQEWIDYRFERGDHEYQYFGKDTDGDGVPDTPKTLADYGRSSVNWRDVMLRKAFSQQYGLSIRTNVGKDTRILAGIGYLDQQGLIVNNGYNKYTGKLKLDHKVSPGLKIGANVNYARTRIYGAATSSGGNFTNRGLTQMIYLEKPVDRFVDPDDASTGYTAFTSIYDCITSETSRTGISDRTMGNAYVDWTVVPALTWRTYVSGDIMTSSSNEFYSANTRWGHSNNGVAQVGATRSTGVTASSTLTWRPELNGKTHLDAMGGVEMSEYSYEAYSQMAVDFADPTLREMYLAGGTLKNPSQSKSDNARMSAFGRANCNWDYRYYLSANFRADGSSKFAAGSRVGYFPSLSAAWKISNEPWARTARKKYLDNLKLRLSAGASGNDRISNYSFLSTMAALFYSDGDGKQIIGSAGSILGNPDLKWETTWQYDAGLDLSLWKGRLDLVADIYYKDTRDMLFMATVPSQTGFTSQWQNIGRVENKGVELTLNTVNVKRGEFSWNTSITLSANSNRILSLGDGVDMVANNVGKGSFKEEPTRLMVGQPIGIIWGYVWDGNYQLDDFDIYFKGTKIPASKEYVSSSNINEFDYVLKKGVTKISGVEPQPGDRKLKDLTDDGIVKSTDDKTVLGKCSPDFTYGIANTFSWRGFSLYVFFDGVQGRSILNEFKNNSVAGEIENYTNITKDAYYNAWRPENGSNKHARLTNQTNCQSALSSYYVEDGSFVKLRTLSLGWNLPAAACRAIHLEGLKITLSASNVFTWTAYSGLDPDVSYYNSTFSGLDRLAYPASRTVTAGVTATF